MTQTQWRSVPDAPRVAAVDLGSNMFRCVIAERDKSLGNIILEKRAEVVAIAEGLWETGSIGSDSIARALGAMDRIHEFASDYNVSSIRAVATGAFRKARNRDSVIEELSGRLRAGVEVIHAQREAELALLGVRTGCATITDFAVLDVGGVSTEFIVLRNGSTQSRSIDIGVITLTERGRAASQDPDRRQVFFERTAYEELEPFESMRSRSMARVYAVGGAAVAVVAHRDGLPYCSYVGGESVLHRPELAHLFADFRSADPESRAQRIGISREHGDLIPAGFAILDAAMRRLKLEAVIPSGRGVSEGLAFETLTEMAR